MTFTELLNDIYFLTGSSSVTYPIANSTANINRSLNYVVAKIFASDGRWEWDDSNQTDLPIATTALVSGQQDYQLALEHLKIERVEVADEDGVFHKLAPISEADLFDTSITEFMSTDGSPKYYDKRGGYIFLYPAPDYARAASLKVYFQRGPSEFAVSDTTKTPGFASLFHRILSLSAAYDYALPNGLPQASKLLEEKEKLCQQMEDFYSQRDVEDRPKLSARLYRFN